MTSSCDDFNTAQKMKISTKDLFSKCDKFTEEILNGKLNFLRSVIALISVMPGEIITLILKRCCSVSERSSKFITEAKYYIFPSFFILFFIFKDLIF